MCENAVYPDMVVLHLKVHILQVKVHISNIFCLFVTITQEKADEGTVGEREIKIYFTGST